MRPTRIALGAATIVTLALASCASPGEPVEPVELTISSWVFISADQEAFMDEVETESDGSITFTPIENWTEPDGVEKVGDEFALTQAVAAGEVDIAFTSTRSFPALGIDGFRAIEAPFLIQSYAGAYDIVKGQIGKDAIAAFDGTGLTPLSVYTGSLKYPLAAGHPLLEPSDWAGKRIASYASEDDGVVARTITALGGEPIVGGVHLIDDLNDGSYDGGFDSLYDVAAGGAGAHGPFPTSNVTFWPSILFYVMNTERFDSLSDAQREIIRTAAEHATEANSSPDPDLNVASSVCNAGARFGTATPEQLAALRRAVEPVYDWLESDPAEAPLLEALQEIAADHPEPDPVDVPEGCAWDPALAS
jgi:TRAP-type C4-dicarboxylate transport system substrate-binding protein